MICPKCDTNQEKSDQCNSCGIYIEKYINAQTAEANTRTLSKEKKTSSVLLPVLGVAIVGILTFIVIGGKAKEESAVAQIENQSLTLSNNATNTIKLSLKNKLHKNKPPKNNIEESRNATVFIETSWGSSGSGFLVDSKCRVITNRHVVEFDRDGNIQQAKSSTNYHNELARQKEDLAHQLQLAKMMYHESFQSGDDHDAENLRREYDNLVDEFNSIPESLNSQIEDAVDDQMWKQTHTPLTVSLIDGTEFKISQVCFSDKYDLATFYLPAKDCPFIAEANPKNLAQGDRLLTIGNPSGLTYTVTAGIFQALEKETMQISYKLMPQ